MIKIQQTLYKEPVECQPKIYQRIKTRNEVLTKGGSTKDVHNLEFRFVSSSSIKYEVGDVVELPPSQNPSAIDAFIENAIIWRQNYSSQ
ncbi:unnamed protein product [Eruca vesicaria subsp. sativa]|uniref:Uncharacterized protein n=1 Tax=Eruca vesicaria subsp. sativa TaxID=29727 RepID=A0ABC8JL78_ERUVS|nr:unnamed protein product [Eruca vesicaria subsp. sativa]